MNKVALKIATLLVSLFLLVYVVYQVYSAFYMPVRSMRVASGLVEDSIETQALVLHNDTVITGNADKGIVDYVRSDGERVSKGGTVANIYPTAQDAANERKLQSINEKIRMLEETGTYQEASAIDVSVLDAQIGQSFLSLAADTQAADTEDAAADKTTLLGLLNKKQLATGVQTDYNSRLNTLKQQQSALGGTVARSAVSVTSPVAGYFVSSTDGYEGAYDIRNILSLTDSELTGLMNRKTAENPQAVGKIVSDYKWYIACILPQADTQKLKVGSQVGIRFLLSGESEVPVTVEAINRGQDGRFCAVLSCGYMTSKLAVMRKQTVQIVADSYQGIKLSSSLMYIVNGVRGVYVVSGNTAQFKKVDIVFSGNGYFVSAVDTQDSSLLQPYDEVILNGTKLYDGKIIR
jgi:hypothetical protein